MQQFVSHSRLFVSTTIKDPFLAIFLAQCMYVHMYNSTSGRSTIAVRVSGADGRAFRSCDAEQLMIVTFNIPRAPPESLWTSHNNGSTSRHNAAWAGWGWCGDRRS